MGGYFKTLSIISTTSEGERGSQSRFHECCFGGQSIDEGSDTSQGHQTPLVYALNASSFIPSLLISTFLYVEVLMIHCPILYESFATDVNYLYWGSI